MTKHKQNNKLHSKRSELTEIWFCVVAKFPFDKIIGRFKLFLSESFGAAVFHVYDPSLLSEYESRISGLFCFVLPTQRNWIFSTVQTTEVNGANDFIVFFIFFKKTFSIQKYGLILRAVFKVMRPQNFSRQ